jgi:3-isopropylmalate dehydrogenase
MRGRHYTVACLAGSGLGPELMAEASRALAAAAHPHGVTLEEAHAPFGSEAFLRLGHPLPLSTRRIYGDADAILLAGADPALSGVEADLELRARLVHVVVPGRVDLCVVSPLDEAADEWAVQRAFELACTRHGRIAVVAGDERWRGLVAQGAGACAGIQIEELRRRGALAAVAAEPERFDVVLGDRAFADALAHVAAFGAPGRMVAFGRLAASGPGVFFPDQDVDDESAGQGMADPGPMLLAAALALGEGLGERGAGRTLERALTAARLGASPNGHVATSRELTDAVLAGLPSAVDNAEFLPEVAAA